MDKSKHPLRAWRAANTKTLAQLAKDMEVAPSHLSQIETFQKSASLGLAKRLAERTGIPAVAFLKSAGTEAAA